MSHYHPVMPGETHQRLIHAGNSSLRYLEVDRLTLSVSAVWPRPADGREAVVVPLAGRGAVAVEKDAVWRGEIARNDVFASAPSTAYVPSGVAFTILALTDLEVIVVTAPGGGAAAPVVMAAERVSVATVGAGPWERQVRTLFGPDGASHRLIVGETINPPGNWSGMPPHKHDEATAEESLLEEIYYFRLSPPDGYLVQLLYDRQGWEAGQVISGEGAVAIARGYHPTVAAPGTTGYYLWALAGPEKSYRITIDPAFAWMREGTTRR